jgi:hypothetical protein
MTSKTIDFVYANGCSWTQGYGLEKDQALKNAASLTNTVEIYREHAWPGQLGKFLGCEHRNDGLGAESNQRVIRTTCDFIKSYPKERYANLLVVIGWTSLERDEVFVEYGQNARWLRFNPLSPMTNQLANFTEIYPEHVLKDICTYHEIHNRYVQNNRSDLIRFYQNVYLMANLLENLGIRYLFFSSFGGWSKGNGILEDPFGEFSKERSFISGPRFMGMDLGYTMLSFCNENNIPLSDCLHPMIDGHRKWALHLRKTIKDIFEV